MKLLISKADGFQQFVTAMFEHTITIIYQQRLALDIVCHIGIIFHCAGGNLHDFDITVQPTFPTTGSYPTAGPLCAHYAGQVPASATVGVSLTRQIKAKLS